MIVHQIKKLLHQNSLIYRILSIMYHLGDRLWLPKQKPIDEILESYSHLKKNVFFIQIGSNDGVSGDSINKYVNQYNWQGLLVEPVSYLFKKLKRNYSSHQSRLVFENSAVSSEDGEAIFYRLKTDNDPNLPSWYSELGTFNKEIILKHKNDISGFDDLLIEEKIKTISFNTLLQKHNIENVDLIQIDTEGYDFEIIKLINFKNLKLDIIIFEHRHLNKSDHKQSIKILNMNGFKLFADNGDTIGIKKSLARKLASHD
jgi:FkbM family methyltransferase